MKPEARILLEKINRLIDTSPVESKLIVQRYISLANRRLHSRKVCGNDTMAIAGASYAIKANFQNKFGDFYPMEYCLTEII